MAWLNTVGAEFVYWDRYLVGPGKRFLKMQLSIPNEQIFWMECKYQVVWYSLHSQHILNHSFTPVVLILKFSITVK